MYVCMYVYVYISTPDSRNISSSLERKKFIDLNLVWFIHLRFHRHLICKVNYFEDFFCCSLFLCISDICILTYFVSNISNLRITFLTICMLLRIKVTESVKLFFNELVYFIIAMNTER